MTRKEKAIQETKREIERLQKKLDNLEKLPEFYEERELADIEDFPIKKSSVYFMYLYSKGISTLGDLLHSKPETILSIPYGGKATLRKINEWLQKHNLLFID